MHVGHTKFGASWSLDGRIATVMSDADDLRTGTDQGEDFADLVMRSRDATDGPRTSAERRLTRWASS